MIIRQAQTVDIIRISEIENMCFPVSEAASLTSFQQRFSVFAECFFVLEVDGMIAGHINGCITDKAELPDELYENANLHQPKGKYQTVFGLAVDPTYQGKGYASLLLEHFATVSKQRSLEGIVLTCKEHLIGLYEKHEYVCRGPSASSHGGSQWFDMVRVLN